MRVGDNCERDYTNYDNASKDCDGDEDYVACVLRKLPKTDPNCVSRFAMRLGGKKSRTKNRSTHKGGKRKRSTHKGGKRKRRKRTRTRRR